MANELANHLTHASLGQLVELTLATGFLFAVAMMLDRLFERRISASVRLWLFLAVFARVYVWPLLLALLPSGWPSALTFFAPTTTSASAPLALSFAPAFVAGAVRALPALSLVYVVGVVLLFALWALARVRLARRLRVAQLCSGDLHAVAGVPVLEHPTLGPLVAGVWRPRIVLPLSLLAGTSGPDLAFVLAHEAAHVKRRDHLLLPALQLLTIAAWPVLPLWLAARHVRLLVELACDERVLAGRSGEQRRRYGELLLAVADGVPPLRAATLGFGWELRARFRALKRARRWPLRTQAALVASLGAVLLACSGAPPASEPAASSSAAATPAVDAAAASPAGGLPNCPPDKLCGVRTPLPPPGSPAAVTAPARGSLDKAIIQRVIRAAGIGPVKDCYETGLLRAPKLGGRIDVSFTIGASGAVVAHEIASSTVDDPAVGTCIDKAIARLKFPPPEGGGIVVVRYPFTFTPAGG